MNENETVINDEQRMKIATNENNQQTENIYKIDNIQMKDEFTILKMISQQFQTIINKIINITIQMKQKTIINNNKWN